jgi:hypothetical protein
MRGVAVPTTAARVRNFRRFISIFESLRSIDYSQGREFWEMPQCNYQREW